SNVFGGSPFARSLKGDGRSLAKNRGSLRSGMKICGWLRSISYRAVVPLLGWPTMKKSGTLPWGAAICVSTAATPRPLTVCDRAAEPSSREDSGDAVIAPECNEVPVQVLAQREHLTPESVTQLEHQIGVRLLGLGDHEAALNRFERGSADPLWHERLERRLCGSRGGPRAHRDRVHELVEALGAHGESRVGLDGLDRARVVHVEEAQHAPHRRLVLAAEVVVDQHQHLLGREALVIAAQLLDIANVLGVQEDLRPQRPRWDVASLPPRLLEIQ